MEKPLTIEGLIAWNLQKCKSFTSEIAHYEQIQIEKGTLSDLAAKNYADAKSEYEHHAEIDSCLNHYKHHLYLIKNFIDKHGIAPDAIVKYKVEMVQDEASDYNGDRHQRDYENMD